MYQLNMYILNLHNVRCQLYLNKGEKQNERKKWGNIGCRFGSKHLPRKIQETPHITACEKFR